MSSIFGFLYFIFALSLIIIVHELGHLWAAKKFNVHCYEFSIGMGPKAFTFYKDSKGTIYNVRFIPFGGYVQMAGEEESKDLYAVDKELQLPHKKPFQRFVIYIAGVVMNFILSFVLVVVLGLFIGIPQATGNFNVVKDSPIDIKSDASVIDINKVNGIEVETMDMVISEIDKAESKVELDFLNVDTNENEIISVTKNDGLIGISQEMKLSKSFKTAMNVYGSLFVMIIASIQMLFSGAAQVSDLSGPIGILGVSMNVFNSGLISQVLFIAFLSVNVGVFNLLPIPALDGGRILFVIIEIIFRRPISKKLEEKLIIFSFLILMGLFVIVTFNDVLRLFGGN